MVGNAVHGVYRTALSIRGYSCQLERRSPRHAIRLFNELALHTHFGTHSRPFIARWTPSHSSSMTADWWALVFTSMHNWYTLLVPTSRNTRINRAGSSDRHRFSSFLSALFDYLYFGYLSRTSLTISDFSPQQAERAVDPVYDPADSTGWNLISRIQFRLHYLTAAHTR